MAGTATVPFCCRKLQPRASGVGHKSSPQRAISSFLTSITGWVLVAVVGHGMRHE